MRAILVAALAAPGALGWAIPGIEESASNQRRDADALAFTSIPLQLLPSQNGAARASRMAQTLARTLQRRDEDIILADPTSSKNVNLNLLHNRDYVGSMRINGQELKVILDISGGDSWILKDGFACVNENNEQIAVGALPSCI
jgi:hypothetical protein